MLSLEPVRPGIPMDGFPIEALVRGRAWCKGLVKSGPDHFPRFPEFHQRAFERRRERIFVGKGKLVFQFTHAHCGHIKNMATVATNVNERKSYRAPYFS